MIDLKNRREGEGGQDRSPAGLEKAGSLPIPTIAFIGGTGPEGRGLAVRFTMAGAAVVIGSRSRERAKVAAEKISKKVPDARVQALTNDDALEASDVICLAFPYEALDSFLQDRAKLLAGKLILDVINPLERREGAFTMAEIEEGSAAQRIQSRLPECQVVSAFKNQSATELLRTRFPLQGDVLLCSNFPEAKARVASWVRQIPNLRPIDAGTLASARFVEGITALLLNLNHSRKALASVRILGLD